jgi:hypothetical protein
MRKASFPPRHYSSFRYAGGGKGPASAPGSPHSHQQSTLTPYASVRFVWLWHPAHHSVQDATTMHWRRAHRVADGADGKREGGCGRVLRAPPAQPSIVSASKPY